MNKRGISADASDRRDNRNMKAELKILEHACEAGKRVVLYGMRNAGKASLVKSLLLPRFFKNHSNAICVYTDLMGGYSLEDVATRLRASFEKA